MPSNLLLRDKAISSSLALEKTGKISSNKVRNLRTDHSNGLTEIDYAYNDNFLKVVEMEARRARRQRIHIEQERNHFNFLNLTEEKPLNLTNYSLLDSIV